MCESLTPPANLRSVADMSYVAGFSAAVIIYIYAAPGTLPWVYPKSSPGVEGFHQSIFKFNVLSAK